MTTGVINFITFSVKALLKPYGDHNETIYDLILSVSYYSCSSRELDYICLAYVAIGHIVVCNRVFYYIFLMILVSFLFWVMVWEGFRWWFVIFASYCVYVWFIICLETFNIIIVGCFEGQKINFDFARQAYSYLTLPVLAFCYCLTLMWITEGKTC